MGTRVEAGTRTRARTKEGAEVSVRRGGVGDRDKSRGKDKS